MSRSAQPTRRPALPGLALAGFIAAAGLAAQPATADEAPNNATPANVDVVIDQARVMHISQPADVVIIGNPGIADATIQDNQTLIITGHSFGTTNLIVLDSTGKAVANAILVVKPGNDQVVTVYRRASRQTFSCTPDCSPVMAVGDNPAAFDAVNTQIQAQSSLATAGASGAAGGAGAK
jgi:Flp pilus assembly secretin CpaC